MTIGSFDGVHHGHRVIIDRLKEKALSVQGESVLVTFAPHPRLLLFPNDNGVELLSTDAEKIALLTTLGIDHLVLVKFDEAFASQSAVDYVENFLIERLQTHTLIIGHDHKFGKGRVGDYALLKQYSLQDSFELSQITAQEINEIAVSSTKIRNLLYTGDILIANEYLGSRYTLSGKVVHGNKIGRKIGFATANIDYQHSHKLLPAIGIYAVWAYVQGKQYQGMLYIGKRPTIDKTIIVVEVHIINFESDIYGEHITVEFVDKIREDHKFESLEALSIQLEKDKSTAIKLLS